MRPPCQIITFERCTDHCTRAVRGNKLSGCSCTSECTELNTHTTDRPLYTKLSLPPVSVCGGRVCCHRCSCPKRLEPKTCSLPPTRRIGNRLNDRIAALVSNGGEVCAACAMHPTTHEASSKCCVWRRGAAVARFMLFLPWPTNYYQTFKTSPLASRANLQGNLGEA